MEEYKMKKEENNERTIKKEFSDRGREERETNQS